MVGSQSTELSELSFQAWPIHTPMLVPSVRACFHSGSTAEFTLCLALQNLSFVDKILEKAE